MKRRDFIKLIGTASGASIVTGCGLKKKTDKLIPYLIPPEDDFIPGTAIYQNSTCTECPANCGLSVKVTEKLEGTEYKRYPIKLEGVEGHPINDNGALCIRGQSSLTRLYHPDRVRAPLVRDEGGVFRPATWSQVFAQVVEALKGSRNEGLPSYYLSSRVTGTLSDLIDIFCKELEIERLSEYELYSHSAVRKANKILFGRDFIPRYKIERADFLLTVGADILETYVSPVYYSSSFASVAGNGHFNWYHVEPHVSLTGLRSDKRLAANPGAETHLLAYLLRRLIDSGAVRNRVPEEVIRRVPSLSAEDVAQATGIEKSRLVRLGDSLSSASRPLVIVGGVSTTHARGVEAAFLGGLIQWATGATNDLADFSKRENYDGVGAPHDLKLLAERLKGQNAGVFFISKVNGLDNYPELVRRLKESRLLVGLSDKLHGVMKECDVVLPLSHSLESWGDAEPRKGLRTIIQPVLEPLHTTLSEGDVLLGLLGEGGSPSEASSYQEFLLSRLKERLGGKGVEELIDKGFYEGRDATEKISLSEPSTVEFLEDLKLEGKMSKPVLVLAPSVRKFDGRSSDLPLLSEIPDPTSTISYGKWVFLSEGIAKRENLKDGDEIELSTSGFSIKLPVKVEARLPDGVVLLHQDMADNLPHETDPRTGEAVAYYPGIEVRRTNQSLVLPVLAGPLPDDDREIIPFSGRERHGAEHEDVSMYQEHEHPNYRWAMAVDLDRCSGCSACVAACYIENNIPVVGPKEHVLGREMSWIRIEQHDRGEGESQFMPMMCQQCDNAPCEPVCPVFAAYHNEDGLNAQIYNRCVGTRYCSNNCPYKVRRFNWFEHEWPDPLDKMLNPDVSVRNKGVMEKCTFCIQRIRVAKDAAKDESRKVRDGEITPACAQTCPTDAIVFGNMKDKESGVHKMSKQSNAHQALDVLGTEPAVYYITEHDKSSKS